MHKHIKDVVFLGTLALAGCIERLPPGSGRVIEQSRTVAAFSSLDLEQGLRGSFTSGPTQSLTVIGDDNLVGYVYTIVSQGHLSIGLANDLSADGQLRVEIVAPSLTGITVAGGAQLTARGLSGEALAIAASGAAQVAVDGDAGRLTITESGASDVRARDLQAGDVEIFASGASLAEVCAHGMLALDLSGASHALYSCSPAHVITNLSGASTAQEE
jgi:hypothetical protein